MKKTLLTLGTIIVLGALTSYTLYEKPPVQEVAAVVTEATTTRVQTESTESEPQPKVVTETIIKYVPQIVNTTTTKTVVQATTTPVVDQPKPVVETPKPVEKPVEYPKPVFGLYTNYMLEMLDDRGKLTVVKPVPLELNGITPKYFKKNETINFTLYGSDLGTSFYPTRVFVVSGCSPFKQSPQGIKYIPVSTLESCFEVKDVSYAPDRTSLSFTLPGFITPDVSANGEGQLTKSYTLVAIKYDSQKTLRFTNVIGVFNLPVVE